MDAEQIQNEITCAIQSVAHKNGLYLDPDFSVTVSISAGTTYPPPPVQVQIGNGGAFQFDYTQPL